LGTAAPKPRGDTGHGSTPAGRGLARDWRRGLRPPAVARRLSVTRRPRADALTAAASTFQVPQRLVGAIAAQDSQDGGSGGVSRRSGDSIAQAPGELGNYDKRDRG
jgi:hypothetical protein